MGNRHISRQIGGLLYSNKAKYRTIQWINLTDNVKDLRDTAVDELVNIREEYWLLRKIWKL